MIRSATPEDIPAILRHWNHVIRDTAITFNTIEKTAADLAALLVEQQTKGHAFFVAEMDGEVVGFASYGPFRNGIGYSKTMEHSIALDENSRGQGMGRALLTAIEDHARAGGNHSLIAGVSGENPLGRKFHAAMGYKEVATLPEVGWKFGRWIDLHLMQKMLT